jgi:UDP-glucose 4-epimerase
MIFTDKRILITGGTGSLGKVLVNRLLTEELGRPQSITVFSRDEAKQNDMRMAYKKQPSATDEIIYHNADELLQFVIGDVRDFHSVASVLRNKDIVVSAAALKQVPTCEYFPFEAVQTNIIGPENIIRSIREHRLSIETVVGISTDKACQPVNVMGMTKAIQERVFTTANLNSTTRFVCVRYGNVLASRGSVIPLFHEQIRRGGPVTITSDQMTRFLISLNQAVDLIFLAVKNGNPGETYIPKIPSVYMIDLARALIGHRDIPITITGVRPGEKLDELLVSKEECNHAIDYGDHFVILPILPELQTYGSGSIKEYSSRDYVMAPSDIRKLLIDNHLRVEDVESGELLR